jgi:hypothetical protein
VKAESEATGTGAFLIYVSTFLCWISLMIRPIIVGILWFDSHDFLKIIKGNRGAHEFTFNAGTETKVNDDEYLLQKALRNDFD